MSEHEYTKRSEKESMEDNDFFKPHKAGVTFENQSTLTSNVTGKNLHSLVFDYSDSGLKKEHKEAAEEIISVINDRQSKNIPLDMTIEELKQNFKLDDIPELDYKKTLWYQFTKDERLGQQKQGYRIETVNGVKKKIPHISFSADLDYLDDMINRFVKKVKQLNL